MPSAGRVTNSSAWQLSQPTAGKSSSRQGPANNSSALMAASCSSSTSFRSNSSSSSSSVTTAPLPSTSSISVARWASAFRSEQRVPIDPTPADTVLAPPPQHYYRNNSRYAADKRLEASIKTGSLAQAAKQSSPSSSVTENSSPVVSYCCNVNVNLKGVGLRDSDCLCLINLMEDKFFRSSTDSASTTQNRLPSGKYPNMTRMNLNNKRTNNSTPSDSSITAAVSSNQNTESPRVVSIPKTDNTLTNSCPTSSSQPSSSASSTITSRVSDVVSFISLDISENELTCQGVEILAKWFTLHSRYVRLRILKIYKNLISDAGALALADLISNQSSPLEELHLSHNRITGIGADALFKSIALAQLPVTGSSPSMVYPRPDPSRSEFLPVWIRLEYNNISDAHGVLQKWETDVRNSRPMDSHLKLICFADRPNHPHGSKDPHCSPARCLRSVGGHAPLLHLYSFYHQSAAGGAPIQRSSPVNGSSGERSKLSISSTVSNVESNIKSTLPITPSLSITKFSTNRTSRASDTTTTTPVVIPPSNTVVNKCPTNSDTTPQVIVSRKNRSSGNKQQFSSQANSKDTSSANGNSTAASDHSRPLGPNTPIIQTSFIKQNELNTGTTMEQHSPIPVCQRPITSHQVISSSSSTVTTTPIDTINHTEGVIKKRLSNCIPATRCPPPPSVAIPKASRLNTLPKSFHSDPNVAKNIVPPTIIDTQQDISTNKQVLHIDTTGYSSINWDNSRLHQQDPSRHSTTKQNITFFSQPPQQQPPQGLPPELVDSAVVGVGKIQRRRVIEEPSPTLLHASAYKMTGQPITSQPLQHHNYKNVGIHSSLPVEQTGFIGANGNGIHWDHGNTPPTSQILRTELPFTDSPKQSKGTQQGDDAVNFSLDHPMTLIGESTNRIRQTPTGTQPFPSYPISSGSTTTNENQFNGTDCQRSPVGTDPHLQASTNIKQTDVTGFGADQIFDDIRHIGSSSQHNSGDTDKVPLYIFLDSFAFAEMRKLWKNDQVNLFSFPGMFSLYQKKALCHSLMAPYVRTHPSTTNTQQQFTPCPSPQSINDKQLNVASFIEKMDSNQSLILMVVNSVEEGLMSLTETQPFLRKALVDLQEDFINPLTQHGVVETIEGLGAVGHNPKWMILDRSICEKTTGVDAPLDALRVIDFACVWSHHLAKVSGHRTVSDLTMLASQQSTNNLLLPNDTTHSPFSLFVTCNPKVEQFFGYLVSRQKAMLSHYYKTGISSPLSTSDKGQHHSYIPNGNLLCITLDRLNSLLRETFPRLATLVTQPGAFEINDSPYNEDILFASAIRDMIRQDVTSLDLLLDTNFLLSSLPVPPLGSFNEQHFQSQQDSLLLSSSASSDKPPHYDSALSTHLYHSQESCLAGIQQTERHVDMRENKQIHSSTYNRPPHPDIHHHHWGGGPNNQDNHSTLSGQIMTHLKHDVTFEHSGNRHDLGSRDAALNLEIKLLQKTNVSLREEVRRAFLLVSEIVNSQMGKETRHGLIDHGQTHRLSDPLLRHCHAECIHWHDLLSSNQSGLIRYNGQSNIQDKTRPELSHSLKNNIPPGIIHNNHHTLLQHTTNGHQQQLTPLRETLGRQSGAEIPSHISHSQQRQQLLFDQRGDHIMNSIQLSSDNNNNNNSVSQQPQLITPPVQVIRQLSNATLQNDLKHRITGTPLKINDTHVNLYDPFSVTNQTHRTVDLQQHQLRNQRFL